MKVVVCVYEKLWVTEGNTPSAHSCPLFLDRNRVNVGGECLLKSASVALLPLEHHPGFSALPRDTLLVLPALARDSGRRGADLHGRLELKLWNRTRLRLGMRSWGVVELEPGVFTNGRARIRV